jgi:hypothetical protein
MPSTHFFSWFSGGSPPPPSGVPWDLGVQWDGGVDWS